MTTIKRRIAEIAKKVPGPTLQKGYLAEEYDGIGNQIQVLMSRGSSSAVTAFIAIGSVGTEQTYPAGTPVFVLQTGGRLEVVSLGSKMSAGSITPEMLPSEGMPGDGGGTDPETGLPQYPNFFQDGTLPAGALLAKSIDSLTPFADTLRPIMLVTSLPTLPDGAYPPDTFVYFTLDTPAPALYKNVANAWVKAIGANDIQSRSITAGQIEAGAITAYELHAEAVTADKLLIGGMSSRNLLINGGFREGIADWTPSANGTPGYDFQLFSRTATDWTLPDGDTPTGLGSTAYMTGSNTASTFYPLVYQDVKITGGEWYSFSALLGVHRLTQAYVALIWKDSTGTQTGVESEAFADVNKQGGHWLADWSYVTGSVQAPADAVIATFLIVGKTPNTSGTDWYLFFDQCWFGKGRYPMKYQPAEVRGLSNESAEILIDKSGLTILNGKLVLKDAYGATVMTSAGFAGPWLDFIGTGLYNSDFFMGVEGGLSAGRTAALPYWTVVYVAGSPTITRVADTAFPGSYRIRVAFSALADEAWLGADYRAVLGGHAYSVGGILKMHPGTGTHKVDATIEVWWINAAGSTISTSTYVVSPTTQDANPVRYQSGALTAPMSAKLAQVSIRMKQNSLIHDANSYLDVGQLFLPYVGAL